MSTLASGKDSTNSTHDTEILFPLLVREEEKILRIPPTYDWVEGTGGGVLRGSQCE